MLEELLKYDKIGNREELLFFLFDGLSTRSNQSLSNIRKYCISNIFSISRCFKGLTELFQFILFIEIRGDNVSLNKKYFDQFSFQKQTYLDQFHLYENLFDALKKEEILQEMFNENNLKFNRKLSQYYILENKFPYKYFLFRNLLLSTGFFQRHADMENHLIIKKEFTNDFKNAVVNDLCDLNNLVNKISLTQLKKKREAQEAAGKIAEQFALKYEYARLKGHPNIERISIISEEFVNAGYDISTFEDIDSVVLDRFIEVKSYSYQDEISFFWSRNEIETSKKLGNKYYIYLINRDRMEEKDYEPQKFQDPYKKIFESDLWRKENENWKITLIA